MPATREPDRPLPWDNAAQQRLHQGQHHRRREILAHLISDLDTCHDAQDPEKARSTNRRLIRKIEACGRDAAVWQSSETGELSVSRALCRSRVCPTCGRIRSEQLRRDILPLIQQMDCCRMLTLTMRSSAAPLQEQLADLRAAWRRLRRSKQARRALRSGVYVIEITYNWERDQWHPHMHVLFDGQYWDQKSASAAWEAASGGSSIVDIRMVHARTAAANYMAKYVSKCHTPTRCPAKRFGEWSRAVHGLRLVQTFGELHGSKLSQSPTEERGRRQHIISLAVLHEHAYHGDTYADSLLGALSHLVHEGRAGWRDLQGGHDAAKSWQWSAAARRWWLWICGDGPPPAEPRFRFTDPPDRPQDKSPPAVERYVGDT